MERAGFILLFCSMRFLQEVYFNNTVASYLQVAIAISLAFLIRRIVSKYLTKVLFRFTKGKWSGLSLEELDRVLIRPIERFFMIVVTIVAFARLKFPEVLIFEIQHVSSRTIVWSFASFLFIYGIASLLTSTIEFIALVIKRRSHTKSHGEHQLLFFFKDFIKVVIIIFAIVFIIKYSFHTDVGKVLTGLSIIGAALALAARESLENLIASFVIFFDKPFVTGDTVKIKDVRGAVEKIGLRSTRIRTIENSLVTVPNKQMVDNILDNFSTRSLVRHEATINVPAKYPVETLKQILEEMHVNINQIPDVKGADVYLREFVGDNAVVSLVYYSKLSLTLERTNDLRQNINIGLKAILDRYAAQSAV